MNRIKRFDISYYEENYMVTLKDIAERLNVSIPLVSKVLNNSRSTVGVSEQTAERIRKASLDMGYVRNRSAVALRKGRHDSIGLLMQLIGAPGTKMNEYILSQISDVAIHNGQQLQLGFYRTKDDFELGMSCMTKAAVDGLIISGPSLGKLEERLLEARKSGLPIVTLGVDILSEDIPNVGCNEHQVGALAARHLIERGCSRIAHLSVLDFRYDGYVDELAAHNIPLRPELVVKVDGDETTNEHVSMEAGIAAVRNLLARGVEFDGLTTQCDAHSMAALKVFNEAGIRVPEDVKIVGVDNSPVCLLGLVPLSSVDTMPGPRAKVAIEMMLRARRGEKLLSVSFEPELCERQSSAL